jgi:radical SAM superfamily enzyme YgiQ (UPF0313 family)
MRVALIEPKRECSRAGLIGKIIGYSKNTLPVLAAYTPTDVDLIDENLNRLQYRYDIAGISVTTPSADRAYEIADKFLEEGTLVVLGGPHVTALPAEAKEHADIVVTGPGELVWRSIIKNQFKEGIIEGNPDLGRRLLPDRSVNGLFPIYDVPSINTSIGCEKDCEFCAIHLSAGDGFQKYSIDSVIADINSIKKRYMVILDDNLYSDKEHAKELLRRIEGKRWFSQASLDISKDAELLRLMKDSGCQGVYIGLDKLLSQALDNHTKEIIERLEEIHNHGIDIEGGLMFGFDHEDRSIFDKTIDFCRKAPLATINPHILTPYPGTRLYARLKSAGRLLDRRWKEFDTEHVVFTPGNMTVEELREGYNRVLNTLQSKEDIKRRVSRSHHRWISRLLNNYAKKG